MALRVAMMLLGAGAVYGGIRADLQNTRQKADDAMRSATRAHERLDDHIQFGKRHDDVR